MDEQKDKRLKYVDMPGQFAGKASEIEIACKQSQRACEKFAKQLASRKAKDGVEFERIEAMKEFVATTATVNERVLNFMLWGKGLLSDVAEDANILCDGAVYRDRLKEASDTIQLLTQQRDKFADEFIEDRRRNKADTQQPS